MDTQIQVASFSSQIASLAALTATGGLLATGKVHLFANSLSPLPTTPLSDLVEATFTGYAAISFGTFGAPYIGPDGFVHITAPGVQFIATDGVVVNTIYGAYLTDTAGTLLIAIALFVEPVPITQASDGIFYAPDWMYGQ
jgi:hypothetical protein